MNSTLNVKLDGKHIGEGKMMVGFDSQVSVPLGGAYLGNHFLGATRFPIREGETDRKQFELALGRPWAYEVRLNYVWKKGFLNKETCRAAPSTSCLNQSRP
jgi:hypothetical protein